MYPNIAFLLGAAPDPYGRTLQDYRAFSAEDWEAQHDVIQMAFPTKTQSKFHPNQPFLPADFSIADMTPDAYQRCRAAISLLLHSYLNSLRVEFLINHDVPSFRLLGGSYLYWADSRNHNTLRLTRILDCLGIFGLTIIQQGLHDFLVYEIAAQSTGSISAETVAFWVAAKENNLHLLR